MVRLCEVAELNPRVFDKPSDDALVSFVPMAAVDAETATVSAAEERPYGEVKKGYTGFLQGDILVAKITPCFENGKIAQANIPHRFGFGSTEFHVIRPESAKLDARYLLHFLRQERVKREGERKMTGSGGQRRVPESFLSSLEIPLPPLAEQRRIADILDRAEALRAKRREALGKVESLPAALFGELFGSRETITSRWPVAPLGELCSPKQWSTISSAELTPSGFPVYGANGIIGFYSKSNHERPTVLVTCRGATCGTINVTAGRCYVTGNSMALNDPDETRLTLAYLEWVLRVRGLQDAISGSAQPQITRQNLSPIRIPVPPLDLQHEFARRVAAIDRLKAAQRASLAEMDALFASLQQRAFRGEL